MTVDHRRHRGYFETTKDMPNLRATCLISRELSTNTIDCNHISGFQKLRAIPLRPEQPTLETLTIDLENHPTPSAHLLRVADDRRLSSIGAEPNLIDFTPFR
jgi:hypothetical protein